MIPFPKTKTLKEQLIYLLDAGYPIQEVLLELNIPFNKVEDDDQCQAFIYLKEAIKIINEGWYPNWNDEGERKYGNYFNMKGGFSYYNTYYWDTNTSVPSALVFKDKENAIYIGDKLFNEYKEFYC